MEECEALCTRLAIMVNGRFQCIGGVQHLKSRWVVHPCRLMGRFGKGYQLKIKTDPATEEGERVYDYVLEKFPNCVLKEAYAGEMTFQVKKLVRSLNIRLKMSREDGRIYLPCARRRSGPSKSAIIV